MCFSTCLFVVLLKTTMSRFWRFDDFMALAPEVNKINPRSLDLLNFWPWLQKSTKSTPEALIQWLSGLGSRSRQNVCLKSRFDDFDDFLALAPEIDKISTRSLAKFNNYIALALKSTKVGNSIVNWKISYIVSYLFNSVVPKNVSCIVNYLVGYIVN